LEAPNAPSVFYQVWLWKAGLACVRILPDFLLKSICVILAEIYFRLHPKRREMVVRNLLPVVGHNRKIAEQKAHELFHRFAVKLAELWRFESGIPMDRWRTAGTDWGILETVCARKRGVLLLTLHLGNWELGGALLARRGIRIVVLTQAEPSAGLTELRRASRARWGIGTFVIGSNGFEFVEIIRRLQAGENMAMLIDRPPEARSVEVELFGRPFRASVAAAELARASGCALLGVVVAREGDGYTARILREFTYDRASLGSRENRQRLTQQILSAFEPEIRRYPEQWFHFVPVWPGAD
jgi:KDO2-lipid IV(A) lauroyltransferase